MNEPTPEGVDFTPVIDVFDTPNKYIVHVSLPGAKKSDLSIDYEAEESVLRLAGVVHRPGVDEDVYQGLVMEERGREVGVFEREVRFGTQAAPAFVVVEEISAKLEDGVLKVVLPKVVPEPEAEKKKVVIVVDDLEGTKGDAVDEKVHEARESFTPDESEASDIEYVEGREYVNVPVQ
jgi:HSP20 family protein